MESSETCWIYSKGFTRLTPQHNTQEQTVVVNSTVSTTQDTACCYVYSNSYTGKGRLCADVYQAGTGTAVCSLVGWLSPPLSLSLLLCSVYQLATRVWVGLNSAWLLPVQSVSLSWFWPARFCMLSPHRKGCG